MLKHNLLKAPEKFGLGDFHAIFLESSTCHALMSRIEHSYKFCKFHDSFSRFRFKFNKFCDFSLNSTRYTKIRCLNDFSVRCAEIYNFIITDQQAPACRFHKIYKIYDFSLTSRFFNKPLRNLRFFVFLCDANSTYKCRPADFTKFAIFRS